MDVSESSSRVTSAIHIQNIIPFFARLIVFYFLDPACIATSVTNILQPISYTSSIFDQWTALVWKPDTWRVKLELSTTTVKVE